MKTSIIAACAGIALSTVAFGQLIATSESPAPARPGDVIVAVVKVTPAARPTSTGIRASSDLSPVGENIIKMYDDGTNGDPEAGDNRFTLKHTVPETTVPGEYLIKYAVTDEQARRSEGTWTLIITPAPCSADFNGDGDAGTDADIEAFFKCLAGSCCTTCGSADFDNDGDSGTDKDIESFFSVLAGGPCE
jgi:hypothetical protein